MKLYKTTDERGNIKWSGSAADATSDRAAMRAAADTTKRDFAQSTAVEVPTSKKELLAWLNREMV